ncbi:uncharacterized protein METZ01_LOCUS494022, partial [marine metagenome]
MQPVKPSEIPGPDDSHDRTNGHSHAQNVVNDPGTAATPALTIEDLSVRYNGHPALEDVTFRVSNG